MSKRLVILRLVALSVEASGALKWSGRRCARRVVLHYPFRIVEH